MRNIFGKIVAAGFVMATVLISVFGAAGQGKLPKLPKSENLEIVSVEVVQVLEHPVSLSDVVLANTDKGYVLKCSISNNLGTPINGMDYLLTWNCTHIANAALRPSIEAICRDNGFEPPVICTPEELLKG